RVVGPAMQVQGLAFLLAAFARLAATLVLIGNKAPRLPRIQSRAADGPKPALSAALKMRRRTFDAFDASLILGRTARRRHREGVANRAAAGTLAVGPTPCVTLNRTRARSAAAYARKGNGWAGKCRPWTCDHGGGGRPCGPTQAPPLCSNRTPAPHPAAPIRGRLSHPRNAGD